MRRGLAARCVALASRERGALLWVPGVLCGTSLILFGIHQAPQGMSFFTHTTAVRIVVGAWDGPGSTAAERGRFVQALRRGLGRHGTLAVVDSARVARRIREAGYRPAPADSAAYLRAIRPLNPHLALRGQLAANPERVGASLEAWDVHAGRRAFTCEGAGATVEEVGASLAESVGAWVLAPAAPAALRRGRER